MGELLSIGAMARRLGVSVVTLRRWERLGKLIPASRTLGGHRRYDPDPGSPTSGRRILHAPGELLGSAR